MSSRKIGSLAEGVFFSRLLCFFVVFSLFFVSFSSVSAFKQYDIDIEDVDFSPLNPTDGMIVNFSVVLKNAGSADVQEDIWIDVELLIDGSSVEMISFDDGLQNGEQKTLYLEWMALAGNHSYEVVVFCDGLEVSSIMDSVEVKRRPTDLFIDEVVVDQLSLGVLAEFEITLGNQGLNLSKNCKLSLYVDEKNVDSMLIRYLNFSKTTTVVLSWLPDRFDEAEIKVVIDDSDVLDEINESDNVFEQVMYIDPYQVTWWDENWHFRKFFAIDTNGSGWIDVDVQLNNTVEQLGLSGVLDYESVWLVRYNRFGEIVDDNVSCSIDLTCCHDKLFFEVSGSSRQFFCLYVDVIGNTGQRSSPNHNFSLQGNRKGELAWIHDFEGWWMDLVYPHLNTTVIIDDPIRVEINTQAKASNVSVGFSNGLTEYEVFLNSDDGVLWSKDFDVGVEGWFDIEVFAVDDVSYGCELMVADAVLFRFLPEISIVDVTIPTDVVDEFSNVSVSVELFNNESWGIEEAGVCLFVEQDPDDVNRLRYDDAVDAVEVDIGSKKSKEVSLSWNASYGLSELNGRWNIGVKVSFAQSTVLRFDAGDVNVSACERTPPEVVLLSFESSYIEGDRIEIVAEIRDESGVQSVQINISFESDVVFSGAMQKVDAHEYGFVFDDLVEVGSYQMQIVATDASLVHSKRVLTKGFSILADSAGPQFSYCGSCPEVVLLGSKVSLFCVVSDRSGVSNVTCEVIGPNNLSKDILLSEQSSAPGRFVAEEFFSSPGVYEYACCATDGKNNSAYSEDFEFWVVVEQSDFDGDGLPNEWEQLHGFDFIGKDDFDGDDDGDGLSNGEEFSLGTDPRVPEPWYDSFTRMLSDNWGYLLLSVILTISIIVVAASELRRIRG